MKIKTHQRWAYYLRVDFTIGTNMPIERFHLTFKSSSPDGQSCTIDKAYFFILKIYSNEEGKRHAWEQNHLINMHRL